MISGYTGSKLETKSLIRQGLLIESWEMEASSSQTKTNRTSKLEDVSWMHSCSSWFMCFPMYGRYKAKRQLDSSLVINANIPFSSCAVHYCKIFKK